LTGKKTNSRKSEIIKSAIELIAQEGIQNLTIKNLAARVGVTEGALYRHFTGKMEILLGILETFEETTDELIDGIRETGAPAMKQLESLFTKRFRQFSSSPELASVIFAEEIFQNDPCLTDQIIKIMKKSDDFIKKVIEQGQNAGEIRADIPCEQLSLLLMGSIRLIVARWHLFSFNFDLTEKGEQLWNSIKKMIQTDNAE